MQDVSEKEISESVRGQCARFQDALCTVRTYIRNIERLSSLYFVKDQRDLQRKYREANKWLAETIVEIEREGFRD